MPLVEWGNEFSIGVDDIDKQHKQIVAMINKLHDAIKAGSSATACVGILDEMIDYASQHFALEQDYMKRLNYPDSAEHIDEHEKFATECRDFAEGLATGRISLSLDIGQFLLHWLYDHIRKIAMKLGQFILQHDQK